MDGILEIKYLGTIMRAGGLLLTEEDVTNIIKEYDPENTNTIDIGTYFVLMARLSREKMEVEEAAKFAIKKLVKDALIVSDGAKLNINFQTIKTSIQQKGGDKISDNEMELILSDLEIIGDKKTQTIDINDLTDWCFAMNTKEELKKKEECYKEERPYNPPIYGVLSDPSKRYKEISELHEKERKVELLSHKKHHHHHKRRSSTTTPINSPISEAAMQNT